MGACRVSEPNKKTVEREQKRSGDRFVVEEERGTTWLSRSCRRPQTNNTGRASDA